MVQLPLLGFYPVLSINSPKMDSCFLSIVILERYP